MVEVKGKATFRPGETRRIPPTLSAVSRYFSNFLDEKARGGVRVEVEVEGIPFSIGS